ncbi:MAG: tol-pal system protein YbgF [Desulfobacter sp.]|nr:MAG: tol-pal system protein YbgF [Desulfobacter sp.]
MLPAKRIWFISVLIIPALLVLPACGVFAPKPEATPTAESGLPDQEGSPEQPVTAAPESAQIESLEQKIDLLEDKIHILESQLAGQKKVVYTIEYSDPAQLYKKARTLLLAKEYNNAADLFTTFAQKHPDHSLADNAVYWLGECRYTTGQYKEAVTVFKSLVKSYPKAEKVPDALLKTGYAYLSLDDINRASHYLTLVIKKHPFSPAAEKAQIKLKEFQ